MSFKISKTLTDYLKEQKEEMERLQNLYAICALEVVLDKMEVTYLKLYFTESKTTIRKQGKMFKKRKIKVESHSVEIAYHEAFYRDSISLFLARDFETDELLEVCFFEDKNGEKVYDSNGSFLPLEELKKKIRAKIMEKKLER